MKGNDIQNNFIAKYLDLTNLYEENTRVLLILKLNINKE